MQINRKLLLIKLSKNIIIKNKIIFSHFKNINIKLCKSKTFFHDLRTTEAEPCEAGRSLDVVWVIIISFALKLRLY